jgi:hypothetical protein
MKYPHVHQQILVVHMQMNAICKKVLFLVLSGVFRGNDKPFPLGVLEVVRKESIRLKSEQVPINEFFTFLVCYIPNL